MKHVAFAWGVIIGLALLTATLDCATSSMTHDYFVKNCKLKSHDEGKLERTVAYAQGLPTQYGYVYLRGDNCYQCQETLQCFADGDEP